jgi:hypothetical protein
MSSDDEYLVHISELSADVEKEDIIEYFKQNGIDSVNISVLKA